VDDKSHLTEVIQTLRAEVEKGEISESELSDCIRVSGCSANVSYALFDEHSNTFYRHIAFIQIAWNVWKEDLIPSFLTDGNGYVNRAEIVRKAPYHGVQQSLSCLIELYIIVY
jgi:hypothetical protein